MSHPEKESQLGFFWNYRQQSALQAGDNHPAPCLGDKARPQYLAIPHGCPRTSDQMLQTDQDTLGAVHFQQQGYGASLSPTKRQEALQASTPTPVILS